SSTRSCFSFALFWCRVKDRVWVEVVAVHVEGYGNTPYIVAAADRASITILGTNPLTVTIVTNENYLIHHQPTPLLAQSSTWLKLFSTANRYSAKCLPQNRTTPSGVLMSCTGAAGQWISWFLSSNPIISEQCITRSPGSYTFR